MFKMIDNKSKSLSESDEHVKPVPFALSKNTHYAVFLKLLHP